MAEVLAPQAPPALAPPVTSQRTSASLYVGDLSPEVTEAMLYETFQNAGTIASIRVCRDAVTRRSLGYAYVNFVNPPDAERAIDAYNYTPILNRPCRIMFSQRDPSLRRSNVGNIFVKGLDPSIDNKELHDAFSVFGNILSVKVVLDEKGISSGRGFVQFGNVQHAEEAIRQADGTLLKDKKIHVAQFKPRTKRMEEAEHADRAFNNVFVQNLPADFPVDQLNNIFGRFGTITSSVVISATNPNFAGRAHAFVCFSDPVSAKQAVEEMNDQEIAGSKVLVARAQKKRERKMQSDAYRVTMHERSKGTNLYIKNLGDNIDEAKLKEMFESFGQITSASVQRDNNGVHRGFGFINFSDQAEATRAITEMNGRLTEGKPLYVAVAQTRDERRKFLNDQWRQRMQQRNMNMGMMGYPNQPMMFGNVYGGMRYGAQQYNRFGGALPVMAPRYGMPPFMAQQGFPGRFPPQQQFNRGPRSNQPRATNPQAMQPNQQRRPYAPKRTDQAPTDAQLAPQQGSVTQRLASMLAAADPDRQKQILGDNLYQVISSWYPNESPKLTGMLLQMENTDIMQLLDDPSALRAEVDKAFEVLVQHQPPQNQ